MIKLIASDMDGTLLDNEHRISQKNVDLINYAQENNIIFIVATGRAYYEALPSLNEKNIDCDVISFNGGIVYDKNGNLISITPIVLKDLYYTTSVLKSLDINFQLYTKNTIYTNNIETDIQGYADLIRATGQTPNIEYLRKVADEKLKAGHVTEVDDIELFFNKKDNPPIKVIGISNDLEQLKKAKELLADNTNITVTSSGPNNIEIMDKNATKGHALKQISEIYNIPLDNILAIGDNLNDESMLKLVKYSVAMENAVPELKKISRYITDKPNSESGVADTVTKILQEENTHLHKDINTKLIEAAIEATNFAYVPYSNFKVGAAILADNGKIYTGCNIENASYSPTNCAERTAIFKAVSEGVTKFKKIAVVGGPNGNLENYCPPCGVCRQVIAEFADNDFELILGTANNSYEVYNFFEEVLPLSFTAKELNKYKKPEHRIYVQDFTLIIIKKPQN